MNRVAVCLILAGASGYGMAQAIPPADEKSDAVVAQAYAAMSKQCVAANNSQHWEEAVKLCSELDTIASRFPDEARRNNEIREAYVQYGEALAFSRDVPSAIKVFRAAVALADKYLKPDTAEYATAFYWQAFAEHASGDSAAADKDYTTSEQSFRKAIETHPEMKAKYGIYLAHTLSYHATLLGQTGRPEDATRLKEEARALDPNVILDEGK